MDDKEDPIVIAAALLYFAVIQVPRTIVLALRLVLAGWGGR